MSKRKRIRRRIYLVDRRLQVAATLQLVAVLFGIGLLYIVGLQFLPDESLEALTARETRAFLHRATAIYFTLATAILGTMAILALHRIAGPAYVIEKAVVAMRKGDYGLRLSLRKRDYLKGLAAAVAGLRSDLKEREDRVKDLMACIEEDDLDGARELVGQLRGAAPLVESAPVVEPTPVVRGE